ncbi:MAG: radical SAM family heme chaperone HemW [Candidatus Cloacimonadaceae bacterium]
MTTGVYIHVPFCLSKCGYCNFYSVPYSAAALNSYVSLLQQEIECFNQAYDFEADTVYFGGGTPSLLKAEQINAITDLINIQADAEITLEANPIQITEDWVRSLAKTKVNRLSLGVQSLHNDHLAALGRRHSAESVPDRIKLCRDFGYDNISLDLMYGLPNFSEYRIEEDLEKYLALRPEHISTYLLSIEENVPFRHWKELLPDDLFAEKQYHTICNTLSEAGFEHYEISNFALPGRHSRHNLRYWLDEDCIGLGASASGFIKLQRYRKPDDLEIWQYALERKDILYQKELETKAQQKANFIIMQLRLTRGLDLKAYQQRFGTDFISDYNDIIERFVGSGHLEMTNGFIRLTSAAWFVSNSILREFV